MKLCLDSEVMPSKLKDEEVETEFADTVRQRKAENMLGGGVRENVRKYHRTTHYALLS